MAKQNSYTFKLNDAQIERLTRELGQDKYEAVAVPHAAIAVKRPDCRISLFHSGKCLIQGKGAEEWISFVFEPEIMQEVLIGYDEVHHPEAFEPHMGIDESGKGDFFGPLVIASAYVDPDTARELIEAGVKDSKAISSDKKAMGLAREIAKITRRRFSVVTIGPESYNRLYKNFGNLNKLLAWGHATAIENLLEKVPDCPRAVADQFGPRHRIESALLQHGQKIELVQRTKAESDIAVAAASILARATFLSGLEKLSVTYGVTIPKGASARVREVAEELVREKGPQVLTLTTKNHFKTTDQVLSATGHGRSDLES